MFLGTKRGLDSLTNSMYIVAGDGVLVGSVARILKILLAPGIFLYLV